MKVKYFLFFIVFFKLTGKLYTQEAVQLIDSAMYFYQEKQYEKSYRAFNTAFVRNEPVENRGYVFYCFSVAAEECNKTSVSNQYLKKALKEGVINSIETISYLKENHPLYKKNKQYKDTDSLLNGIYINFRAVIKRDSLYFLHLQDTVFKINDNRALTLSFQKFEASGISAYNLLDSLAQFNGYPKPPKTNYFVMYLFQGKTEMVPYVLFIPNGYDPRKKQPLYVYLHGGSASIENFAFTEEYADKEPIFKWGKSKNALILYPLAKRDLGWHKGEEAIKNVYSMINNIKKLYNINDAKISFIGMSNGAVGVIYTALHEPKHFKNFIAISSSPDFYKDSLALNNLTNTYTLSLLQGTDDEVYSYQEHVYFLNRMNRSRLKLTMDTFNKGTHGFIYTDSGYTFLCDNLDEKTKDKVPAKDEITDNINWAFKANKSSEYRWLKISTSENDSTGCNIQIEKKGNNFFVKSKSTNKFDIVLSLFYKQMDLTKPVCVYNEENRKIFEQKIILDKKKIINAFKENWDRDNILISEILLKL